MNEILDIILNGMSPITFLGYMWLGYIGVFISYLLQYYKHQPKIKAQGGFELKYWLDDNKWRIVLSVIIVPIGVMFSEQLLGMELTRWTAFMSGIATDNIVDALTGRKKGGEDES